MSLKLNLGLSKKVGLPDYGSLGASCHVEFEADPSLLFHDRTGFQAQVRDAYAACQEAVQEQLASQNAAAAAQGAHDRIGTNGVGRSAERHATAAQVRALRAIAGRRNRDLAAELTRRYGLEHPEALSIRQASELIDLLKEAASSGAAR